VDIAIAALHELRRTGCDARLTIAGEGPAFRRLQALAVRMTVSPWIEWRGKVPESEMEVYYNAADVLLFPSLRDSGGMVVLEALSHGLPVVCADLGGPRRIVTPECGRIVVTQQRQRSQLGIAFADAVRDIMSRPELRQSLADGACRRAMDFQFRDLVRSLYPAAETPAIGATA
jgi:glycosyltransferase involved in cell wall biosynthesis